MGIKNVKFLTKDVTKEALKEKFDIIICSEVLEHLKEPLDCIKNIKAMLKKQGIAIITTPNRENNTKKLFPFMKNKLQKEQEWCYSRHGVKRATPEQDRSHKRVNA